jgi:hypothetical protein
MAMKFKLTVIKGNEIKWKPGIRFDSGSNNTAIFFNIQLEWIMSN